MLFITIAFLIIAIMSYILYMVSSSIPLYHAVNTPIAWQTCQNPKLNTYHIVSSLPNKTIALSQTSNVSTISSLVSTYRDSYEQAFINACENVRWLSIQNNCTNPNDFNQAWSFLPSLSNDVRSITGTTTPFSCNTVSNFGQYVLYQSISGLLSNTCVSCYYNLNSNSAIPYSGLLPYKSGPYGTNTTHSTASMGDPCAVGSFISCTYNNQCS